MGFFNKQKKLEELLDQAVSICFFTLLLADNGEKLYERLKRWTETGYVFEMFGDEISEGNRLVMQVNEMILECFKDQSFEELSTRYKEGMLKAGLPKDW